MEPTPPPASAETSSNLPPRLRIGKPHRGSTSGQAGPSTAGPSTTGAKRKASPVGDDDDDADAKSDADTSVDNGEARMSVDEDDAMVSEAESDGVSPCWEVDLTLSVDMKEGIYVFDDAVSSFSRF